MLSLHTRMGTHPEILASGRIFGRKNWFRVKIVTNLICVELTLQSQQPKEIVAPELKTLANRRTEVRLPQRFRHQVIEVAASEAE
jgi:hypothetical protein